MAKKSMIDAGGTITLYDDLVSLGGVQSPNKPVASSPPAALRSVEGYSIPNLQTLGGISGGK